MLRRQSIPGIIRLVKAHCYGNAKTFPKYKSLPLVMLDKTVFADRP